MSESNYYIEDNSDIEDTKLEAARRLYSEGNYAVALKLYLDMVNTSYSYKLHYEIGRCYYKLNDIDQAELYFQRSISLEDIKNPSYVFLGNIFFKKSDVQKAIEYWTISYSYKPDDEAVCLNLATSYFSKDMKFQSVYYYEKYLKYAKDKTSNYYLEIKRGIDEFKKLSEEFYSKAQRALSMKDSKTAIQALEYAVKNYPLSFDSNYLLGRLYLEEKDYMHALIYLKQAYIVDNKSLDVLERLSSVMINLGDFTGAYCVLKRIIPLVLNNQKEYLGIIQTIRQLENSFDSLSPNSHKEWGDKYYNENSYHLALFEYENCQIIDPNSEGIGNLVDRLKRYINPEDRMIKLCMEKGGVYYSNNDFRQSNKYFSKIMTLANSDSYEYRFAKSRLVHV